MSRTAVVIYNLGGPDSPEAVRPFLKNLFSDPMILRVPAPVRWFLAWLISWRRAPVAQEIYAAIGGRSPILPETEKQAAALQAELGDDYRVFVAMRYWHPFADAVVRDVAGWGPDRIVLLPLYPQYSTTTTESFTRIWYPAAKAAGLSAPTSEICCWPEVQGFVEAVAKPTDAAIETLSDGAPHRVLFSAHGLPKKIVDAGDPYAHQVERTAAAVLARMKNKDVDHIVCYQSRVGPMEWLQPYTEDEIKRAGSEKRALVVVPVAFVSEHSETLVELDIEYAELARDAGVPEYVRVPTVNAAESFIRSLAELVKSAPETGTVAGGNICDAGYRDCPCRQKTA
ncbi:MAG: ferrochelatase [Alphaproteobacteria bacterium]